MKKDGKSIINCPVSPNQLGSIIDLISTGDISGKIAKELFEIIYTEGGDPIVVVEKRGMKQVTDSSAIEKTVAQIITDK